MKGDKIDCSLLSPMCEFSTMDDERRSRIKKGHIKYKTFIKNICKYKD